MYSYKYIKIEQKSSTNAIDKSSEVNEKASDNIVITDNLQFTIA